MKIFPSIAIIVFLSVGTLCAADIDGKWVSERTIERQGQSFTMLLAFDLKADGGKLTGTVAVTFGDREPMTSDIENGKLDGNNFAFTTVFSTPNGEYRTAYEGTVDGDTLKGSAGREGGQSRPFEAKRK